MQLLEDVAFATATLPKPYTDKQADIRDRVLPEEGATAPVRELEDHTGIRKESLPPAEVLNDGPLWKRQSSCLSHRLSL